MDNPFLTIDERLRRIEELLEQFLTTKEERPQKKNVERLTRSDIKRIYNISLGTIHNLMKSGQLPYEKIGRKTLFRSEDVAALFDKKYNSIE
ncbi:MAG: helix-turn-helix domain-containing protein [Bacteroidota bacterium]